MPAVGVLVFTGFLIGVIMALYEISLAKKAISTIHGGFRAR
jgi:cbb3-type cytochrome oxidase subunit 3